METTVQEMCGLDENRARMGKVFDLIQAVDDSE
jgi:hypothetical protein